MSIRQPPLRLAVVGGGISGLAAANRIVELEPAADIALWEASTQLGGVLRTEEHEGFLIEYGADNFITTMPWAVDFCQRIGFEKELVETNPGHRRAFVVRKGKLRPIPAGFAVMAPNRVWPILSTSILSPWGKLRLAAELFVPAARDADDESIASFVTRRLGRETYERLVQPLIAGIYTGDPNQLSVNATMPRFREMEHKHGSLIRAMWGQNKRSRSKDATASGARYSQFVAPRQGMSSLIQAVADRLPSDAIRTNCSVERVTQLPEGGWRLDVAGSAAQTVDGVVIALPARHGARLLRDVDVDLADDLSKIEHGSCALATFGFRREQIQHPLDGFGVVVPLVENRQILSASFSSVKYPGRAPEGHVLVRTFLGGACQRELLDLDDEQLLRVAQTELADLLSIHGAPVLTHLNRQVNAMPQYHLGHEQLVQRIMARADELPGISLASNSLHGVGIPQCIHTAELAAERVLAECRSATDSLSLKC